MKSIYVLFGALMCLVLVSRASAQCLCASKGMDFCSCAATPPMRPIPKVVPKLPLYPKFPPIGDSCYCGKQLVEPAIPPKPSCKPPAAPPCKCSCSCAHGAPPALPPPVLPPPVPTCFDSLLPPTAPALAPAPAPAPAAIVVQPPGMPADPLSISMALTARQNYAIPEAKLSYGPVAPPRNIIRKIFMSNIPEEKLYALNAQVIEMKKKFPMPTKAELLAEAIEEAEEEAALAAAPAPAPYLTYSDIGYGPAMIKKPLFMRMQALPQPALGLAVGPKPIETGCGYVPGKITQAPAYLEQPLGYEGPCL